MNRKKVLFLSLTGIVIVLGLILLGFYNWFYDMSRLPKGEFLSSSTSPDGKYIVRTFLCNGGATVDYAVRGEVFLNKSESKNIYWDYEVSEGEISWEDNDTVVINNKKIDLPKGEYDFRKEKN